MATSFHPGVLRIGQQALRSGLALARRFDEPTSQDASALASRSPLQPAAIRIERTQSKSGTHQAAQTAVTLWFGEGPALPTPGGNQAVRGALRVGAGVLGAAALAALTTVAAQREGRLNAAERPRRIRRAPTGAVVEAVTAAPRRSVRE